MQGSESARNAGPTRCFSGHRASRAALRFFRGGVIAMELARFYDVRPHACASIFHSSPRFENV